MRMAIVEVIGLLIREISNSGDGEGDPEAKDKQIDNLYDLLTERLLDLSSYVRVKVLQTLSKLCDLQKKYAKRRLHVTSMTIATLEDKGSSVRKQAIMLLTKLILTHPYGMIHGGPLNQEEWEDRYHAICKELEALAGKDLEITQEGKEGDEDEDEEEEEEEVEEVVEEELEGESDGNEELSEGDQITSSPMKAARKRMR